MYQYRLKMRNIVGIFAIFIVISFAIRAGKFYSTWSKADNGKAETTHQLTLEDIVRLSKKGMDVSWKDFEKYPSKEVGSGLYVRRYEIESPLQLFIGGGDLEEPPAYINLVNSRTGDSFDIRKNDVELMVYRKESKLDGRYDLNHDGIMEKICIEDSSVKENNQSSVQIAIYNDKGKKIWKKGLELSCTGQEGVMIYMKKVNMISFLRVAVLALVLSNMSPVTAVAATTVMDSVPYDFPVTPDDDEWKAFTTKQEMLAA